LFALHFAVNRPPAHGHNDGGDGKKQSSGPGPGAADEQPGSAVAAVPRRWPTFFRTAFDGRLWTGAGQANLKLLVGHGMIIPQGATEHKYFSWCSDFSRRDCRLIDRLYCCEIHPFPNARGSPMLRHLQISALAVTAAVLVCVSSSHAGDKDK